MEFYGKKVLVVGLGKSGIAATEALVRQKADVTVYDKKTADEIEANLLGYFRSKNVKYCLGEDPQNPAGFDVIVMSPGVSPEQSFIQTAARAGKEIISEVELAYRLGDCHYIAITGTNGKTTTTTLTGEIFRAAGRKAEVVGNVGVAVVTKAASSDPDAWMVTEVSSFQLEAIGRFRPAVSAILNITPDHLDRHKTMENYAAAKAKVYQNQTKEDYFVVNRDEPLAWSLAENCPATVVPFSREKEYAPGCFVRDGHIVIATAGHGPCKDREMLDICKTEDLVIPGAHNLENALAAAAITYFAGIGPEVIGKVLREFEGVEHRMEFVAKIGGVRFINDSKGTNPDASIKALDAIPGGIVLIAGGYDKNASFRELIGAFGGKVRALVLLGKTAPLIKATAEEMGFQNIIMCKDMEKCVAEAYRAAEPEDTVLLSPACASWDMYVCFEQRGEHFKTCVKNLEK